MGLVDIYLCFMSDERVKIYLLLLSIHKYVSHSIYSFLPPSNISVNVMRNIHVVDFLFSEEK